MPVTGLLFNISLALSVISITACITNGRYARDSGSGRHVWHETAFLAASNYGMAVSRGRFMSEPLCPLATEQPSADPLPEPIRPGW
jgi:hypothetical protein